jgi:ceramide glucosyltransferase
VSAAFWLLAAGSVLLGLRALVGLRRSFAYCEQRLGDARQNDYLPAVALIVPVKGPEEGLRENLASLASLDYPDYELIVTARQAADVPEGVVPPGARLVLAGDGGPGAGEKINNLLAAIRSASPSAEVLAFADSDGRVSPGWLRALVAPLAAPSTGASTGYRCYLPEPPDWPSLLRSVWNASVLGEFGPDECRFAWGGAMALRKEAFFKLQVPEFWRGSVSDDYGVTAAVRRAGLRIVFAPGALVASVDHVRTGELLGWIRRQMVITRVYNPALWRLSLAATAIYAGATAMAAIAAAEGRLAGGAVLAALWAVEIGKGWGRTRLARVALAAHRSWFERYGRLATLCAPLATWLWLWALLASAFSNRIEWRGRRYRLSRLRTPQR